jgi:hypothetical protein
MPTISFVQGCMLLALHLFVTLPSPAPGVITRAG